MGKHHHHDHHHLQSNEKLTAIAIVLSIGAMGLELFYGYKINSVAHAHTRFGARLSMADL